MPYYRHLSLFFLVLLFVNSNACAQSKQFISIDSLMTAAYRSGMFNGNVLVSKNNTVVYDASFGFTDASQTTKLTSGYRFNIGSITKEFSAVALLQLKQQGRLKLEDAVSRFMPELPQWAHEVTIRDLLRYTSGLPQVDWEKIQNDEDLLQGIKSVSVLDFAPGSNYNYSLNNLFLRQFIVERITGMPFKEYTEKFIFTPCNMTSAVMTPIDNYSFIAKGFNSKLLADKADLPITGGTYLTVYNLLNWTECLYSGKMVDSNSLFESGQRFDLPDTQSALGLVTYQNKKVVQHVHDGRSGSYEAILVSDLHESFTILLLGNSYRGNVSEIAGNIAAILRKE